MYYVLVIMFASFTSSNQGIGTHTTSQQVGQFATIESCDAAGKKAQKNLSSYKEFNQNWTITEGRASYACVQVGGGEGKK